MASAALCDLLGEVGEAGHELAVVVVVARREAKAAGGLDGADRARRHTQLALYAWVVRERRGDAFDLGRGKYAAEQHERAEYGMDHAPVQPHTSELRRDRDRLLGDDPGPAGEVIHLHRERHRGIDAAVPEGGKRHGHALGDRVDVVTRAMKLQVRDAARGAPHGARTCSKMSRAAGGAGRSSRRRRTVGCSSSRSARGRGVDSGR